MDLSPKPVKMILSGEDYLARRVIGSLVIGILVVFVWLPSHEPGWKIVGTGVIVAAIGAYLWYLRYLKPGSEWLDLQHQNLVIHMFRLKKTNPLDSIDHVSLVINDRDPDSEYTSKARLMLKDGKRITLPVRSELHQFFRNAASNGAFRLVQTYSKDGYA